MTIRVMSAGTGYRYLLNSVVTGDVPRDGARALVDYYEAAGTPPGWWLGSGLSGLAGDLMLEDTVTESQLANLLGSGNDPTSGLPLGESFRTFKPVKVRIQARINALSSELSEVERLVQTAVIEEEENARGASSAVAGFDMTFSAPKSVSVLWGLCDAGTRELVTQAHHQALKDVLGLLEDRVASTRIGARGPEGGIIQAPIRGVIAAAYDHYDSRAGDPQLHTHVVVANRVQGWDGKWRTLDSRALHSAVAGLSEHYNAVLTDHLTRLVGVSWEGRDKTAGRMRRWEIAGISQSLLDLFSTRTTDIERAKDELVSAYRDKHGRHPKGKALWQIRQQATLATRPDKTLHPLSDLLARWNTQASEILDEDAAQWASQLVRKPAGEVVVRADDIPLETLDEIARTVVGNVGERRATWRRWNLHAETVRQTMQFRFRGSADRLIVTDAIVDRAEELSTKLTPDERAHTPVLFQREDGTSRFRPRASTIYTSDHVLAAERRLLDAAEDHAGPTISLDRISHDARSGHRVLGADQETAVSRIAISGRHLDVLVGPAGAGKTTALAALRHAWDATHGKHSVIGLASSASAAAVLGAELGINTENTAKWLFEHRRGNWNLQANQLVIIDEASLAGTFALDSIVTHAREVGAKVVLVGDWAQLASIDAGGAFAMLVHARDDAPELVEVRRFRHDWEKTASLGLRLGTTSVIDTYTAKGRVHDGDTETVVNAAYQAWKRDKDAGLNTVLLAESTEVVTQLNQRAQTDHLASIKADPESSVLLHDGTRAHLGDTIITRTNQRRLTTTSGRWVKNGDRWIITRVHPDGSLTARPPTSRWRGRAVLPTDYVKESVELGYAVTAYRAQGITTDTAHTLIATPEMTREALYVAMSRGRQANHTYVATDQDYLEGHQYRTDLAMTAKSILYGILHHEGAQTSATETSTREANRWASLAQLAAEYETISTHATHHHWQKLLHQAGLTNNQLDDLTGSDSYGILTAELRRLDAAGHDTAHLVTSIIKAGRLETVSDLGSILHYRLARLATYYQPTRANAPGFIGGLIPKTTPGTDPDMSCALAEREHLMNERIQQLVQHVSDIPPSWVRDLTLTVNSNHDLATVVAYRDLWNITDPDLPLGAEPDSDRQKLDYHKARRALQALATPTPTENRTQVETKIPNRAL